MDAYARLVQERSLTPGRTWMIGNSPKSDINPALAAGLNAVFVPHAHTWVSKNRTSGPAEGACSSSNASPILRQHF